MTFSQPISGRDQWDNIHDPLNNSGWLKEDEESGMSAAEFDIFFEKIQPMMMGESSELRKTIKQLKEIYAFFKQCNNQDWASYKNEAVIPHCLWRDASSKSIPFTAGVFDGAYLEYDGLTKIAPLINQIQNETLFLARAIIYKHSECVEGIDEMDANYERVIAKLVILDEENIYDYLTEGHFIEEEWLAWKRDNLLEDLKDCAKIFKLKKDVASLYELVSDWKEALKLYMAIEDKVTTYLETLSSDTNLGYYKRGRLAIPVATTLIGGVGALTKMPKVKKILGGIKKLINEGKWPTFTKKWDDLARVVVSSLNDFLKLPLAKKLDNISNGWTTYYPKIFFERKLFEDMMGHYRYKKSSGWGHTGDIAHNFKAIDFYDDFTKVGDDIFANTAVSMKTTTTTNVDNWLASNPIKKNLDNLANNMGATKGIEWNGTTLFYNKAEVHIYMPQANITPSLKATWLNKLATERPGITFKINALEDFIN